MKKRKLIKVLQGKTWHYPGTQTNDMYHLIATLSDTTSIHKASY